MLVLRDRVILVTGAGGFLGRPIVRALLDSGARVKALVGAPGEHADFQIEGVDADWADIEDISRLRELTANSDTIVHLAGPPGVARSFQFRREYGRVHVGGTASVLACARAAGIRHFVYLSSAEVYGRPRLNPVVEDAPLEARSPYAAAKIAAEKLVSTLACPSGHQATILRPFSIYGPGSAPGSLVGTILSQARTGGPVVLADLRPVRDYCHVADLADAVARACARAGDGLAIFNVGTGTGTSVAELAQLALSALDAPCAIAEDVRLRRPEGTDILELVADTTRARSILGWVARTRLREGLRAWLSPAVCGAI